MAGNCRRRWPADPDRCPGTGNRDHHCHHHCHHHHDDREHRCRCGATELDLT